MMEHLPTSPRILSDTTKRISAVRRMREILAGGKAAAYLFGLHPDTYELVMAPGQNVVATLRAETGKQISVVPDEDCGSTQVNVLIEGRTGLLKKRIDQR